MSKNSKKMSTALVAVAEAIKELSDSEAERVLRATLSLRGIQYAPSPYWWTVPGYVPLATTPDYSITTTPSWESTVRAN